MCAVKTQRGNLLFDASSISRLPKRSFERRRRFRAATNCLTYCTTRPSTKGAVGVEQSCWRIFIQPADIDAAGVFLGIVGIFYPKPQAGHSGQQPLFGAVTDVEWQVVSD